MSNAFDGDSPVTTTVRQRFGDLYDAIGITFNCACITSVSSKKHALTKSPCLSSVIACAVGCVINVLPDQEGGVD